MVKFEGLKKIVRFKVSGQSFGIQLSAIENHHQGCGSDTNTEQSGISVWDH